MTVPDLTLDAILTIKQRTEEQGFRASDRRWQHCIALLKAFAYLNGRWLFSLGPLRDVTWLYGPRFVGGALLFFSGFSLCAASDARLRGLRRPGETAYVIPEEIDEVDVTVGASGWALPGKLTFPKGVRPYPVVVLVHGSGPHDMDETLGPNRPFKDLALGLASAGIAVLRYDKRSYDVKGKIEADPAKPRYVETVYGAGYRFTARE